MTYFEGPSVKQAEVIKQELGEGPGDLERGILDLRSMCAANPYLPQPEALDTQMLKLFLRGCRMNFERARKKLELYCYSRSRYRDLYDIRAINEPPLSDVYKNIDILPLPKLTDEGHRITIFRIKSNCPDNIDINSIVRQILYVADIRMTEETLIAGDVFIWEVSQIRMSITTRLAAGMTSARRAINLAHTAYPQRLRRIHVVGASTVFASSFNLIRSWVSEKIRERYLLHTKIEDLLDYYPTRVLPAEWGGDGESIESLISKWRSVVEARHGCVAKLNEICQGSPNSQFNSDIYGVVGSFRKLDID